MSSKQSMSRLKSGTGVARVRENPVAREYARSPANFQRFIWPVPLITTLTYDAASRQRVTVDPAGDQTEIRYFRDGQICAKRDALNVMTLYRYDGLRRNRLVVQNYQAQKDHLDQDVDPVTWRWSNSRWEYLFNAGAAVWNAVAFGTDNDRNVIVQVTYDRVGRVTGRRDPRGSLTSYRYDRLGRRRLLSNPLNQQWLTAFADVIEGSGQIGQTTKRYPLGYAVTHETDRVGRLARVDYGAAASTPAVSFAYDLVGSRVRMDETGATGTVRTTHYAHDRLQRLTQVAFDSDGDGTTDQTVSYAYDAGGLRTTLTLPGEVSITYQYDAAGRLASLTDWDGQVTTFGYDQAGRQTLTARASGLTSRYRHDASGRLREIHHSGPWQVERMLQAYLYALDGRGNRTQAREVRRRATPTAVVTIAHDDGSVVYSGAWAAETAYHVTTSVTAVLGVRLYLSADGQGQATLPIVVGVGPDHGRFDLYLDGTLWETHDGYASVSGERTIDLPVRGVSGEHLLQIRSRADRNPASSGNRLRFRQVSAQRLYDTRTIDYTYDGVSRLIEADYDNGAEILTYGFDVAGNLTNLNGTARTYNAANQLVHDGTNALTYDANGNMTGDGVNSYTWDRANRLLALGGVSYAYNGDGDRVAQTSGVNVTQYLLDLQPGLALVLGDSDGNRYVHAPHGIHAVNDGAVWTYPLTDGLGSVRGYVDANNVVLSDVDYSPYGVPDTAWTGWAFTGEQRDSNALQYHRARYYAPGLGIFPSLDPFEGIMERPMSLNGYAWVEGNVVNLKDSSGSVPNLGLLESGYGIRQHPCISDSPFGCDDSGNAIRYFITQGYGQEPYDKALCQDWDRSGHCGLDIVSHSDPAWKWVSERGEIFMQYDGGLYLFDRNQMRSQLVAHSYFNQEELVLTEDIFKQSIFRIAGDTFVPTPLNTFVEGRKVYALRSGEVEEDFNTTYHSLKVRSSENGLPTDFQIQYIHLTDVPPRLRIGGANVRRGEYIGTYGLFGEGVGSEPHLHLSLKYVPLQEGCEPHHISPASGLELYGISKLPEHLKKACRQNYLWQRVYWQIEVPSCG
jgi:RHS repeat-associated protein